MADEFLSAQTAVPAVPIPAAYIALVVNPAGDLPYKATRTEMSAFDMIFLKKPSGGYLQIEANDDNELIYTPIAVLP